MAKPAQEVYHCPSCGALAPPRAGEDVGRVCQVCGFEFRSPVRIAPRSVSQQGVSAGGFVQRDVSARRRISERVEPVIPPDLLPEGSGPGEVGERGRQENEEVISDDGRRKIIRRMKKRRRTRMVPLLFLCGWSIIVMLLVIFVRNHHQAKAVSTGEPAAEEEQRERAKERALAAFLDQNHESCRKALEGFLSAGSATERTQFVRDPDRLAPVMSDYYKSTLPWTLPNGATMRTRSRNVFMRGDRRAIELVMEVIDSNARHPDVEAAFVQQGDRWVLEWEAFVRYSSDQWQLFVKQAGEQEGEFRVYLRQTAVALQTAQPAIKVQFLPPRGDELMWKQDSEWVVIPLNSENGRRIEAIMGAKNAARELGHSHFGKSDPKGLYRARVALAWVAKEDGKKSLEVKEVLAGNWYGPGFEEDFGGVDPAPAEGNGDDLGAGPEPQEGSGTEGLNGEER